ncbi:hypothetical protein RRG08_056103 [Elysia crispata]|uniref:Uncharacterized protein n=1 Tax=Elysia crispata TaxID=231223 RepID=A0AAE0ZBH5_9GAST|nr:hypothetical protein RRG08_056103 [Elysia crispata]
MFSASTESWSGVSQHARCRVVQIKTPRTARDSYRYVLRGERGDKMSAKLGQEDNFLLQGYNIDSPLAG